MTLRKGAVIEPAPLSFAAPPNSLRSSQPAIEVPEPSGPASNPSIDEEKRAFARARVGTTINNKWRVDALLGTGGMAAVYAATHRNGSRAALKILHSEFARAPLIRDRFLREGYVANKVDHHGRVAIQDDDVTEEDEPFLVMELLEGETVQELWKRKQRKLPVVRALRIAEEVLLTLEHFHEQGVVHRDLKPANIFITREGGVKLLDFGVARIRDVEGEATRAGTALGTPSFMAPEQAMGLPDDVDGRADVFSLGATLLTLMSGHRLHQGRSENEAFILAATQPAPSLARFAPEIPTPVIALVDKALAWDARNRFESARAMREEVVRVLVLFNQGARPEVRSLPEIGEEPTPIEIGDSLRAPPIEERPVDTDVDENDPAVQRLVDVFCRLDRVLPTVRQYGWAHPETDHKIRACFQGIIDALRADSEHVGWTLRPYSFMYRGQTVWEPSPPFDVVPYYLFAGGVRSMRFLTGITEDELRELCRVFLLDPVRDMTPEDDVATVLWEKRLQHVRYEVINVFAEGDAADREHFYDEADRVEDLARHSAEERENRAEAAAMSIATDKAAVVAARKAASVLAIEPAAKKALSAQLTMSPDRWSERFVDVLVAAFIDARRRGDVALVATPLDASVRDLAIARRFDLVFAMHGALRKSLESAGPASEHAALQGEMTRAMFQRDTVVMLLREAIRQPQAVPGASAPPPAVDLELVAKGIGPVLAELGAEPLEALLDIIGSVRHEHLRAELFTYVERVLPGSEALVVERLMASSPEVARPIMSMLAAIRSRPAKDALQRLSLCPSPALRCEGAALLSTSPEQLRDNLMALTESPEAEVRLAALRTLAYHHVRAAGPLIIRKVQDASFHQLSIDERSELLRALYALHAQRAEAVAVEMVQKHGIIPDEALDQTRALVADLLGREAKSHEALVAVLGATKRRWWNGPPVREAAMAAAEAIAARLGKRVTAAGDIE